MKPLAFVALLALIALAQAQLAAGHERFLGNIKTAALDEHFSRYWNQITPEDAGKWLSVEWQRGTMVWLVLDRIFDYARTHGMPVKFHTLVWGQQEPRWVAALPPEEQRAEVEEWFRAVAERYPDVAMIDVVNEPLHHPPSFKEALGGAGETGWDWVIWSFERAREHFPNARLLLNEFNILCCADNLARYMELARLLQERGLIDGIAEQGHGFERVDPAVIARNLDTLAELGLPTYISELCLNTADDNLQLQLYQSLFPIFWEHPAVAGLTLWGYKAGEIWRPNAFLIDWLDEERPALQWLREYLATR